MSHWVKVGTQMENIDYITQALDRMGQDYEIARDRSLTVTAAGTTSEVDIRLHKELGLKEQEDGTFAFVGDFYYTKLNQNQFTTELQGHYCAAESLDRLGSMGFFIDNEEDIRVNEEGLIEFSCTNYSS